MKKWVISSPDAAAVSDLMKKSGLSELACTILVSQGCVTYDQAAASIGCEKLSDPSSIVDMEDAAQAILNAVDEGKRICIYGDYDCDGVMSTVILYSFLDSIGADVMWRIPERSEGYGLNEEVVHELHDAGVRMVVTVDNGISANAEAALMEELGIDLVITDHHQPGSELPHALAVVDAHRQDNFSTYRMYCGAGIALLLVAAMNEGDLDMALEQFGDLAAIATIGDVVALTGENRLLVQIGLEYLENTERPGLIALREVSGLSGKPLTASGIAFGIVPRINAAGRLASPRMAVQLLLEEDPAKAREMADVLNHINADRKECVEKILLAARQEAAGDPMLLHERVLIFSGEGWHHGVIGIAAARMEEIYGKPCFMIGVKDGKGIGSARSFGNFSVFKCLTYCEDLLLRFGGHPAAGGFTIAEENIPAFRARVAEYAAKNHPEMPVQELTAACVLEPRMLVPDEIRRLSELEPFGAENPEPLFFIENAQIMEIRPVSSGVHTKLTIRVNESVCEAMMFQRSPASTGLRRGDVVHMMVEAGINVWNGTESVSITVRDFRISGMNQSKILAAMSAYEHYRRHEALPQAYYAALLPSREELVAVYKAIPDEGITTERLTMQLYGAGINYCKCRIALDIFAELGLVQYTDGEAAIHRLPAQRRMDLSQSAILAELQKLAKEGLR